jgi:hypothetical protein
MYCFFQTGRVTILYQFSVNCGANTGVDIAGGFTYTAAFLEL